MAARGRASLPDELPPADTGEAAHREGYERLLRPRPQKSIRAYFEEFGLMVGDSLSAKAAELTSGGKAPKLKLGGKAPKHPATKINMETIARTTVQLANSIRERRRKLGLSQEQLAAQIVVRQRTLSDIENARSARLDTLLRILAVLDLELVVRERTKSSADDIEAIF